MTKITNPMIASEHAKMSTQVARSIEYCKREIKRLEGLFIAETDLVELGLLREDIEGEKDDLERCSAMLDELSKVETVDGRSAVARQIRDSRSPRKTPRRASGRKYKHTTVRKWNGDDLYSWAIFDKRHNYHPLVSGLSRQELTYTRNQIEAKLAAGRDQ